MGLPVVSSQSQNEEGGWMYSSLPYTLPGAPSLPKPFPESLGLKLQQDLHHPLNASPCLPLKYVLLSN